MANFMHLFLKKSDVNKNKRCRDSRSAQSRETR